MRVVVDANVLVSALISKAGPSRAIVVSLARAARADYVVSGDRHLTGLVDPLPPVLTPRQFLELLGA